MSLSIAELLANSTDQFLTWFVVYGPPMLGVALFCGAAGIPLPGTLFVIAAGAFIRQGVMDIALTPALAIAGAVSGDVVSYGMGRIARVGIQRQFGESAAWQRAEATLQKRGGIAIYLTRWLLTPIAIPTNLVAGSGGYPLWRFIAYDAAGELTWLLLFGGLGYAFGSQWEVISDFISDFSGLLVGILVLTVGIYLLLRQRRANSPSVKDNGEDSLSRAVRIR